MLKRVVAGAWLLAALSVAGAAVASGCPNHYVDGRLPEIRNPKLQAATKELCYGVFGVVHSGLTRTPLWSAEYLRADNIAAAQGLNRENAFHAEPRLPPQHRAELADYARSGFDRGHMSPNGDMPDRRSQRESFSLANIVPQDGENNRQVWASIESAVRKMAAREGAMYVITGPAFLGGRLRKVGNVIVPSHLYKAVYSPRQKAGAAWLVENEAGARPQTVPLAELERIVGIDLFPTLTREQKERMLRLPKIRQKKDRWS